MVSAGAVAAVAAVGAVVAVAQLQRFLGLEMFIVCFLVFFNCFLGVHPVLLDFLDCLLIKGPLEFFILSFFLADPRSESLFFFDCRM